MREVSQQWLDTARTGGHLLAELVCHPADGSDSFELTMASASVEQDGGTGQRWSATIDIVPEISQDTWERVAWPGSWFELKVGFRYGAGAKELISYGQYVHDDMPTYSLRERISLNLGDRWSDLDRAKYDEKHKPSSDERTRVIQKQIRSALGEGQPVSITVDDGGSTSGDLEWDARTKLIDDLSKDGGFECFFDADGVFVIQDDPEVGRPIHVFTDDDEADIIDLTRGARFTEFYNRVSVYAENPDENNFTTQTATLDEPRHPLDPSNRRGLHVPYPYSSKSITSSSQARYAARRLLHNLLKQRVEREVKTYNTAHIEPGDTVSIALQPTQTEGKSADAWIVTKTSYDPLTGDSSLTLASSAEPNIEEGSV